MTLEKAIEIITTLLHPKYAELTPDTTDAMLLAIEALDRIKWARIEHLTIGAALLPGETEE